jgi:hypothetical protein
MQPDAYIVQRYIHNPFLVGGKKFDMRIYAMVTSYQPLTVNKFDPSVRANDELIICSDSMYVDYVLSGDGTRLSKNGLDRRICMHKHGMHLIMHVFS